MSGDKTSLLLACLAAIVRRSGTAIVLADEDVQAAFDNHTELERERDPRAKCVRLTAPGEARP